MANNQNYYSNPAFCQKSEFYPNQRALSPPRSVRQSPVGAQTIHLAYDNSPCGELPHLTENDVEEQEFYEEVVVDDQGFITEKKVVVVAQNNEGRKYIQVPQDEKHGGRYGVPPASPRSSENKPPKQRYEYIPMQEQPQVVSPKSTPKKHQYQEEHIEIVPGRVHRYAVIETEEETQLSNARSGGRYALVPVADLNAVVSPTKNRYEYIQESPKQKQIPRYESTQIIQATSPKQSGKYEYIQTPTRPQHEGNPVATQKLYELLSTPRKQSPQKVLSPHLQRKIVPPPVSPIAKDPFQTPPKKLAPVMRSNSVKAQQKLNYAIGTRQLAVQDKRYNTAIVTPICSSPIQSVYSETTYSNKSESWMNLSVRKYPVQATLSIAALLMLLSGGSTSGLSFFMISKKGRLYYLDFAIVAGFTCLILGLLGFRSRNIYWLPNRNYISGYLVLSLFSMLTCGGLSVLAAVKPPPGTPLADMTAGAVCGTAALSLALAAAGAVASYCCRQPPPDNRVEHCSPGFTV